MIMGTKSLHSPRALLCSGPLLLCLYASRAKPC